MGNKNKTQIENRTISDTLKCKAEKRADSPAQKTITGIAAMVNTPATIAGWFIEEIEKGAFDNVLQGDTRGLFNHDNNLVLGRTTSNTLELSVTPEGHLQYKIKVDEGRQIAKDVYNMIQSGDVSQSSFAFKVKSEKWIFAQNENELDKRIITEFEEIRDVSPVTYPAYAETSVSARDTLQAAKEAQQTQKQAHKKSEAASLDIYKRKLNILKLK